QGPGPGPDPLLRAVRLDQAVDPHPDPGSAGPRAPAVPRGPQEAGRPVRVHPVRLLLDQLPELLVERRALPGPGDPAAGLPLEHRLARRGRPPPPGRPRRSLPAVPLPHHHELRAHLPEGPEPGPGDRGDQEADDGAPRLTAPVSSNTGSPANGRAFS